MMGQPYNGMGLMGYDNNRKLFNSTWVSDMETGMNVARGTLNQDSTILTLMAEMDEIITGEIGKACRQQYHFKNNDEIVFEIAEVLYGDPFKVLDIHYKRCKNEDCGVAHEE